MRRQQQKHMQGVRNDLKNSEIVYRMYALHCSPCRARAPPRPAQQLPHRAAGSGPCRAAGRMRAVQRGERRAGECTVGSVQ